jgi:hypothetical protein
MNAKVLCGLTFGVVDSMPLAARTACDGGQKKTICKDRSEIETFQSSIWYTFPEYYVFHLSLDQLSVYLSGITYPRAPMLSATATLNVLVALSSAAVVNRACAHEVRARSRPFA